jgi:hypothetical protein
MHVWNEVDLSDPNERKWGVFLGAGVLHFCFLWRAAFYGLFFNSFYIVICYRSPSFVVFFLSKLLLRKMVFLICFSALVSFQLGGRCNFTSIGS